MSKIPIVLPVYNRPEYLSQVLSALRNCNNIDKFKLHVFKEPGNAQIRTLLNNIDFMEFTVKVNPKKLGCPLNTMQAVIIAMTISDVFIYLEEDTVPAKDFLNLCLWGLYKFADDKDVFQITGSERLDVMPPVEAKNHVYKHKWYVPWGFASWSDRWREPSCIQARMSTAYTSLYGIDSFGAFGSNILHMHILPNELSLIKPVVPRIKNIGEIGTYVPSPEWHHNNQATMVWSDDDVAYYSEDFELI